jgi:hypothetical protein
MDKIFDTDDYNSGEGMLTAIWGPSLWHTLHTISFNYPVNPTPKDKKNYFMFFKNLSNILPCRYCRENYKKNIQDVKLDMSVMKNRHTFSLWLFNLHEQINKMLDKKSNLTYDTVRDRYEMFRARCLSKKDEKKIKQTRKKENGCVKPLYGVKSKCVIQIVPKNKKCKTFNIDKTCLFKRLEY